jgi:hypothetical protein
MLPLSAVSPSEIRSKKLIRYLIAYTVSSISPHTTTQMRLQPLALINDVLKSFLAACIRHNNQSACSILLYKHVDTSSMLHFLGATLAILPVCSSLLASSHPRPAGFHQQSAFFFPSGLDFVGRSSSINGPRRREVG